MWPVRIYLLCQIFNNNVTQFIFSTHRQCQETVRKCLNVSIILSGVDLERPSASAYKTDVLTGSFLQSLNPNVAAVHWADESIRCASSSSFAPCFHVSPYLDARVELVVVVTYATGRVAIFGCG